MKHWGNKGKKKKGDGCKIRSYHFETNKQQKKKCSGISNALNSKV